MEKVVIPLNVGMCVLVALILRQTLKKHSIVKRVKSVAQNLPKMKNVQRLVSLFRQKVSCNYGRQEEKTEFILG